MCPIGPIGPAASSYPESMGFPEPPKNPTQAQALAYIDKALHDMPTTHKRKIPELVALRNELVDGKITPDEACKKCYAIWKR